MLAITLYYQLILMKKLTLFSIVLSVINTFLLTNQMNFKVMPIGVRLFAVDSPKATPTPKPAAAPTPAAKDPGNFLPKQQQIKQKT